MPIFFHVLVSKGCKTVQFQNWRPVAKVMMFLFSLVLSVPSSISSEPEDGPRLSLAKKPITKLDRELKEGKFDEDVSTKSEGFFLLLESADCGSWPLSSDGQSYLALFKRQSTLQCCCSISRFVDPISTALLLDLLFALAELLSAER